MRRPRALHGLWAHRRPATVLPAAAAAALLALAVGHLTSGSAQATPTSVDIRLQGTSGALFPPGDLAPGRPVQACVDVVVDAGDATAAPVHLGVADVSGALAADLLVTVEVGPALGGVACSASTATTSFTGTLAVLARTSTSAGGVAESAVRPAGASSTRYRITALLASTSTAQGAGASARFVWSVSASSVSVDPVPPPVTDPVTGDPAPTAPVPSSTAPTAGPTTGPTAGPTTGPTTGPTGSPAVPGPPTRGSGRAAPPSASAPGGLSPSTTSGPAPSAGPAPTPSTGATPTTPTETAPSRAGGRGAGDQSGGIFARLPGAGAVRAFIDGLPVSPAVRALLSGMADSGGFPLFLLLLVLLFLAVQNRLDRRDPKLALAPLRRDEDIDFDTDRWIEFDGEFDDEQDPPRPRPRGTP